MNLGTPIYQAILKNDIPKLKSLLNHPSINVNGFIFDNQWRPIMFAIVCNNAEAFNEIIKHQDFDVTAQNKSNETAAHIALHHKRTVFVKQLIFSNPFDPLLENNTGRTVLMKAVTMENLEIVKLLVDKFPDQADLSGQFQDTALSLARKCNDKRILIVVEDVVLLHLNTPVGRALRDIKGLRKHCERLYNLNVRTPADIREKKIDGRWLEWRVPIKIDTEVERIFSILSALATEKNLDAVAIAETVREENIAVPMAKVL